MKNQKVFGSLVATAVAGLLAAAPAMSADKAAGDHYCSPGCNGTSECKGHGNECKGKNSCTGKGWVKAKDEAECKGKGGTWAKNEEKAAKPAEEKKPAAPAKKKS